MTREGSTPITKEARGEAPNRSVGSIIWDLWMVGLAIGSLIMVGWVELQHLSWPHPTFKKLASIDLVIVSICCGEFVYRFVKAGNRRAYVRQNWYELLGLVPMYAESFALLRATRILRLVRVLRLLRVAYAARRLSRSFAFVRRVIEQSRIGYSFSIFGFVAIAMAGVFWLVEHGTNHQIASFDDALWWAVTTAATVGYGDVTPTTGIGRILAILLMLFALGFVGILTSSLSAALVFVGNDETADRSPPSLSGELAMLAELRERGMLTSDEFTLAKSKLLRVEAHSTPATRSVRRHPDEQF